MKASLFTTFCFLLGILLLGAGVTGNPYTVLKYTGIPVEKMIVVVILVIGLLRWKLTTSILEVVTKIAIVLLLILIVVTVGLSLYGAITPVNTLFALTGINQSSLGMLTAYIGIVLLINQPKEWWMRYGSLLLRYLPVLLVCMGIIIKMWPYNYFLEIVKEDHLIEQLQFLILLLGSCFMAYTVYFHYKNRSYRYSIFFVLILFAFIFVAGDEISWGQRLFHLDTPQVLIENNRQYEISIHNIYSIENIFLTVWIVIGITGIFGRKVIQTIFRKSSYRNMAEWFPDNRFIWYFIFPAFHYPLHLIDSSLSLNIRFHEWAEVTELLMYMGIVFWLCICGYKTIKKIRKK